jgi:enoyl-CoA hydratase/carnithine racemase
MGEEVLEITREGPVAVLTMIREAKRNAMNDALLAALDGVLL